MERLKNDEKEKKTDGDETMVKNGIIISKFSFEALGLGSDVDDHIKSKIHSRFVQWTEVMIQCFQPKMDHRRF